MSTFVPSRSLVQLAVWARDRQTDIALPPGERGLWKQIADEIDAFNKEATDTAADASGGLFDADDSIPGPAFPPEEL